MTRIYTRKGDDGGTSLFDGTRVSKSEARVATYGDVDELNAVIGVARAQVRAGAPQLADLDAALAAVQRDLFALGAALADPRRDGEDPATAGSERLRLGAAAVLRLESLIDEWEAELPPLRQFILPAGCGPSAALHVARTVCRRAERAVVAQVARGAGSPLVVTYLNRLSDALFVAARLANKRAGVTDDPW